jgi:hypothetical protein
MWLIFMLTVLLMLMTAMVASELGEPSIIDGAQLSTATSL